MRSDDRDSNDDLSDAQLLERERAQREAFREVERDDPRTRDKIYGDVRGSPALVESWERWWKTNLAARMRGILTRTTGR